jgi:hypothetical protein
MLMKNKFGFFETKHYISSIKMKRGVMIAPPVVSDVRVFAYETSPASTVYIGRFATVSETLDK